MGAILFVRAKSGLDTKELERRLLERRPRFEVLLRTGNGRSERWACRARSTRAERGES
jgi:hypothetical protein